MSDRLALMLEAEKRGILPADKAGLLQEARRRGLLDAPAPEPSGRERIGAFVRGARDTASLGFDDEIGAKRDALLGQPVLPGLEYTPIGFGADLGQRIVSAFDGDAPARPSYDDALAARRATAKDDEERMPVSRLTGQLAGGVAAAVIPGLGGAGVTRALEAGTGVARAGASVGARYGAGYGFGSGEGGVVDRGLSAAGGAATGALGGAVGARAGQELGRRVIDPTRRLVHRMSSGRRAADATAARLLRQSGPGGEMQRIEDLIERVLPRHRSLEPAQRARAFEIYADALRAGPGAVRRAAQRMADEFGVRPATAERQLRTLRTRFADEFGDSPLVLAELPGVLSARAQGIDTGFEDTVAREALDYLANQGGRAGKRVTGALAARQRMAPERMHARLAEAVGGADLEGVVAQIDDQMATAGRAAYQAAMAADQDGAMAAALDPVIRATRLRIGERQGKVMDALRDALEIFETRLIVQGRDNPIRQLPRSLQKAMDARALLRTEIEKMANAQTGKYGEKAILEAARSNPVIRELRTLYQRVTAAMRRANPDWYRANTIWGDGYGAQRAITMGENLALTAGRIQRAQLRSFDRMPPELQERVRVAFAQKLHDLITNARDGRDVSARFRSEGMRAMIRHMFGEAAGDRLIRRVQDEMTAKATQNLLGNSRTHLRGEVAGRMDDETDIAGAVRMLNPGEWWGAGTRAVQRFLSDRRNQPLADILLSRVDDPAELIPTLLRLQRATGVAGPAPVAPTLARRGALMRIPGALAGADALGPGEPRNALRIPQR